MAFSIRQATVSDAELLRELAIRTFCDTFSEGSEPDDMAAYLKTAFSFEQVRAEILDECNLFLLLFAEGDRVPVGYTKLRTGTMEDCVKGNRPIELERLYVDRAVLRQGLGSMLMRSAIEQVRALGYGVIWLGVWEHNERAIAFYKRWGFEQVGEHPFVLGDDHQTDWVMQRTV
ncbi:MAG: GNAT family N-acetyltransferase [Cyanobacteria bacterium J06621_11]